MSINEAIEKLEWLRECSYVDEFEDEENEALDIAIDTLTYIEDIKKLYEAQDKLYKKIFEGGSFLPLPDCMLKEGV